MIESLPKYFLMFFVLILTQVVVFNNIYLGSVISTYPYVLFILLLPNTINTSIAILLAFVLGMSVDVFSDSGGIHAAACVPIAYIRPFILRSVGSDEQKDNYMPGLRYLGIKRFLIYAMVMITVHHTILFYLEVFDLSLFFFTLLKIIGSTLLSLLFMVLIQYIFFKEINK